MEKIVFKGTLFFGESQKGGHEVYFFENGRAPAETLEEVFVRKTKSITKGVECNLPVEITIEPKL